MSNLIKANRIRRALKRRRVRTRITGTTQKPRFSVFRSNRGIELQLIDDTVGRTLVRASCKEVKSLGTKTEVAKEVGKLLADKAKELKITEVIFDRRHYKYHGRIKAAAEGAREKGLKF